MSERSPKSRANRRGTASRDQTAQPGTPLYSHIRELAPPEPVEIEEASSALEDPDVRPPGLLAQAARISFGTAFPALRRVARFLSLESYRSLPKHDRLPDLAIEAPQSNTAAGDLVRPQSPATGLLDWDELEIRPLAPSPYQLYLFDVRIKAYLRQTRDELCAFMVTPSKPRR